MLENVDFKTRNSSFTKIVNLLGNLDLQKNLDMDYYKRKEEVSPSLFDSVSFKDKNKTCTIEIDRYIVGDNPPIFYVQMRNTNYEYTERFWIENPDDHYARMLDKLIVRYHAQLNLDSLTNMIEDVYKNNKPANK